MTTFKCMDCGQTFPILTNGGTGYACLPNPAPPDNRICYPCCAVRDRASMIETGRAVLYLTTEPNLTPAGNSHGETGTVSNWPGSLKIKTGPVKVGHHNMAGKRYDVWFTGPDGKDWHGVQYGENTQICHCRRVK